MRTPNRERATDSYFDAMKQRHRRAIADGRRKSARIRRWKQNHIRDVKVSREVINPIARNRRLRAARTEGRAQWWRWQSGRFGMTRRRREKQKRDEQKAKEGLHAGTVGQTWSDRKVTSGSVLQPFPRSRSILVSRRSASWRYIAMNDPLVVDGLESVGDLGGDLAGPHRVHRPFRNHRRQRRTAQ